MKVATDAQLGDLNLAGTKDLARPSDRVVFRMIETAGVAYVSSDFRCEERRINSQFFGARVPR